MEKHHHRENRGIIRLRNFMLPCWAWACPLVLFITKVNKNWIPAARKGISSSPIIPHSHLNPERALVGRALRSIPRKLKSTLTSPSAVFFMLSHSLEMNSVSATCS